MSTVLQMLAVNGRPASCSKHNRQGLQSAPSQPSYQPEGVLTSDQLLEQLRQSRAGRNRLKYPPAFVPARPQTEVTRPRPGTAATQLPPGPHTLTSPPSLTSPRSPRHRPLQHNNNATHTNNTHNIPTASTLTTHTRPASAPRTRASHTPLNTNTPTHNNTTTILTAHTRPSSSPRVRPHACKPHKAGSILIPTSSPSPHNSNNSVASHQWLANCTIPANNSGSAPQTAHNSPCRRGHSSGGRPVTPVTQTVSHTGTANASTKRPETAVANGKRPGTAGQSPITHSLIEFIPSIIGSPQPRQYAPPATPPYANIGQSLGRITGRRPQSSHPYQAAATNRGAAGDAAQNSLRNLRPTSAASYSLMCGTEGARAQHHHHHQQINNDASLPTAEAVAAEAAAAAAQQKAQHEKLKQAQQQAEAQQSLQDEQAALPPSPTTQETHASSIPAAAQAQPQPQEQRPAQLKTEAAPQEPLMLAGFSPGFSFPRPTHSAWSMDVQGAAGKGGAGEEQALNINMMAAKEDAAKKQLEGLLQMRGAAGSAAPNQQQSEPRPETPWMFQLKKDTMSVDGDAASIDIVSSSNTPSRLGTPLSYSLTPHFGTPLQGNSRPITPLLSSKNVNSMAGGGLVGASNGAAKGAASSVHHHSSKPDSNRSGSRLRHSSRSSRSGLAPFVRQAAPMVLSLEDPLQSTDEVVNIELQSKLRDFTIEELREIHGAL